MAIERADFFNNPWIKKLQRKKEDKGGLKSAHPFNSPEVHLKEGKKEAVTCSPQSRGCNQEICYQGGAVRGNPSQRFILEISPFLPGKKGLITSRSHPGPIVYILLFLRENAILCARGSSLLDRDGVGVRDNTINPAGQRENTRGYMHR